MLHRDCSRFPRSHRCTTAPRCAIGSPAVLRHRIGCRGHHGPCRILRPQVRRRSDAARDAVRTEWRSAGLVAEAHHSRRRATGSRRRLSIPRSRSRSADALRAGRRLSNRARDPDRERLFLLHGRRRGVPRSLRSCGNRDRYKADDGGGVLHDSSGFARFTHALAAASDGSILATYGQMDNSDCLGDNERMGSVIVVGSGHDPFGDIVTRGFRNPLFIRCMPWNTCYAVELSGQLGSTRRNREARRDPRRRHVRLSLLHSARHSESGNPNGTELPQHRRSEADLSAARRPSDSIGSATSAGRRRTRTDSSSAFMAITPTGTTPACNGRRRDRRRIFLRSRPSTSSSASGETARSRESVIFDLHPTAVSFSPTIREARSLDRAAHAPTAAGKAGRVLRAPTKPHHRPFGESPADSILEAHRGELHPARSATRPGA